MSYDYLRDKLLKAVGHLHDDVPVTLTVKDARTCIEVIDALNDAEETQAAEGCE